MSQAAHSVPTSVSGVFSSFVPVEQVHARLGAVWEDVGSHLLGLRAVSLGTLVEVGDAHAHLQQSREAHDLELLDLTTHGLDLVKAETEQEGWQKQVRTSSLELVVHASGM